MPDSLNQTWDLDVIFPGGSRSQAFTAFLAGLAGDIGEFARCLDETAVPQTEGEAAALVPVVERMQAITLKLREADSFTACLAAEHQADKEAVRLGGRVRSLYADFASQLTRFDELLTRLGPAVWSALLAAPELQPIAYPLQERRALAKEKLPPEQEALANALAVDGYHGWGELYNTAVSRIRIPFEEEGRISELSRGRRPTSCSVRSGACARGYSGNGRRPGPTRPISAPMRSTGWRVSGCSFTSTGAGTRC